MFDDIDSFDDSFDNEEPYYTNPQSLAVYTRNEDDKLVFANRDMLDADMKRLYYQERLAYDPNNENYAIGRYDWDGKVVPFSIKEEDLTKKVEYPRPWEHNISFLKRLGVVK